VIGEPIAPTCFAEAFPCRTARFRCRAARVAAVVAITVTVAACAISQQQEVQMGGAYATQIDTQLPMVRDARIVNYVSALGNSLAAVTDTRGLTWHFAVVDSKEVNAFAVPAAGCT